MARKLGKAWSDVFGKTNSEAIKFSDDFTSALNQNIDYISRYKEAVDGGMSKTEAIAKHLASASKEAKVYADSTNIAEIDTEEFARSQKTAEIATIAQTKSLSNLRSIINTYNAGTDKLGLTTDEFNKSVKEGNGSLGVYLSSLNGAKASMVGYIGSLVSAKFKTVALSVASAALNAAITFGISLAIQGVITLISELTHREEKLVEKSKEAKNAIQSIDDEFKEDSEIVSEASERFATLAQKVSDLGKLTQNKGTLSTEEYEEFLKLSNQLAGVFPELTQGYDDNGNAILNLSGNVNTIVSSLDNLIDRQKQLTNQDIIKQLPDLYGGFTISVKNAKEEVEKSKDELDKVKSAYDELKEIGNSIEFDTNREREVNGKFISENYYKNLLNELGLDFIEEMRTGPDGRGLLGFNLVVTGNIDDAFATKLKSLQDDVAFYNGELQSELSSISKYINTWLQGEWIYQKFNDTGIQEAVQKMFLAFDPSLLDKYDIDSSNWDAVSEWIRQNILYAISKVNNEEVLEALSKLFNGDNSSLKDLEGFVEQITDYFGEDSPVYLFIKPKIAEIDDAKSLADGVKKFIKDEYDDKVDELSLDDLEIASSDEFWKFLGVPDGTLLSWNELCASIKRFKKESSEISPLEITAEDTVKNLNDLSKGFEQLDKIYKDVIDGNGFDVSLIADNKDFKEKFSGLDSYTDFLATIVKYPNDIKKCQDAFNQLTNEYIRQSGVLDILNEDNKELVANYLRAMGVENADAIVSEQLALTKRRVAIEKEKDRIETELGTDATVESIIAKANEINATGETAAAYAQLAIEKMLVNDDSIKTSKDIEALENLANAANASAASLAKVAESKRLIAEADKYMDYFNSATDPRGKSAAMSQYIYYLDRAKEALNGGLDYNEVDFSKYKFNYSGADKTDKELAKQAKSSESAANKAANAAKDAFQNEYNAHKHKVQMELESEKSYYDWLEKRSKEVYDQKIIDEGDYWKYQEEVFSGMRGLFKDYLNDVEHEISMRENYDGESKKIISLYKTLISKVESEIAAARRQGLTDNDDYVQELKDKWKSYSKSIKDIQEDITDAAKDALDNLVDYRIDMIKKDIDREKEALDKKLDNLKDFYDKQKEMLQDAADEEKYLDDQAEKRKSITDIQSELKALQYDDSAWAQKRKLELNKELADAQKELDDFEKEHALDLALEAIDNAYDAQEAQIKAEMDALEEKLNDPNALYNQALNDIKNNSKNQLYYTMLMYNRQYGDGKDSTVNEMWEKAYGALDEYQKLFGKAYQNVTLTNSTGYKPNTAPTTPSNTKQTTPPKSSSSTSSTTTPKQSNPSPSLKSGSQITVKTSATNFSSKSGGVRMASFVPGGSYTVYQTSGNEVLIGRDGVYTGWINKSDIVGYASGTRSATNGLHSLDEIGSEYLFTSSDGTNYRVLNSGDKVLNAKATDFLYEFANGGGEILEKIIKSVFGTSLFDKIQPVVNQNEINMGDIIVQGNTDTRTVSEIRRAQRDNLTDMLKSLNKLNK